MIARSDVENAAAYALQVIEIYDRKLSERGIRWNGANVLEIGPGRDFAPQILMVDRGATVTVADRFLATWDPAYHPALYREVRAQVGASPALDRVIEQGGYDGVITTVGEPAESMPSIADESFDIVFSTAVLEHVYDIKAAARELRRVSKPGAINSHQVDFRDHRDFSRPLEHLLMSRRKYLKLAQTKNFEFGCQWRVSEMAAVFRTAGFDIAQIEVSDVVDPEYFAGFLSRLRWRFFSPYWRWKADDLRILGARLWLVA